ncbi:MAG: protease pro-enzyme activation domain-containing protein [Bryobacteraceae bacterium]
MRQFVGPLLVSTVLLTAFLHPSARPQAIRPPGGIGQSRITQQVSETSLVTLRGNTHPLARPVFDRGAAPADLPLDRMLLVLKRSPAQESALKQLLDDQQNKSSPNYHRWLTPEQFGRQFGPSDQDIQTVTLWLASQGFQVVHIANGRTTIEFSGTAGQVQNAFHTAIHKYVINAEEHWANANDPQIPAALTPVVAGITTLNTFRKKPFIHISNQRLTVTQQFGSQVPQFTASDGSHGLSPADYAIIYNINPLYQAGINGDGTTIAIIAKSNIKAQDVASFRSLFGLSTKPPQIILNGNDPGLVKGDETEAVLDTSWSGAVAPNATVKVVVSADTNASDGVDLSTEYIIDNNLADVMTESYGSCEAQYTAAEATNVQSRAQQAAAQGITYIVSTGDSGSAGCDDPNTKKTATGPFSVNILASTPYTIAVGGTQFNEHGNNGAYWRSQNSSVFESAISYIPEDVWNEACTAAACGTTNAGIWASGGGASTLFAKPSWQTGVAGIPNDGARDVPDVSLSAASHGYYLLCLDGSCTTDSQGKFSFQGVSGTSASAPAFAGMMALVNHKTGSRQGQAAPVLYQLAASEGLAQCNGSNISGLPASNCIFNDSTVGNNSVPGQVGYGTATGKYQATAGFDLATGLGSINLANLVNQWSGSSSGSGQVTITPSTLAFGNQAVAGTSAAQTITVSNSGSSTLTIRTIVMTGANGFDFAQSNSCGPSLPPGAKCTVSVTFAPTTTGARSASLTFTDSAANSPQTVSLTGTGTANSKFDFGGERSGDVRIVGDFDGDGELDYATWRPANGIWYIYASSNPGTILEEQWGLPGDIPVAGDYDGDGKTDIAVWRASTGMWFILPSRTRAPYSRQWGFPGDIPVTGDFDADGKADLTVWRPSDQTWHFVLSGGGAPLAFQWGLAGDIPVAGDFDGSGKQEMAVWRPSNAIWYVISASRGTTFLQQWGLPGDIPVPADYDGDGITDFAVWRPSSQTWFIRPSSHPAAAYTQHSGMPNNLLATKFNVGSLGRSVYVRVVGDFDGDGELDFAVWKPSTGDWFVIPSGNPGNSVVQPTWGIPGDVPVPGDFDGDGKADYAVWRPSNGSWFIIPSGGGDPYFKQWGIPGDIPVVADFDGDGKADYAVWRPSNGTWYVTPSAGGAPYSVQWGLSGDIPMPADFEGNLKYDLAVWRPSNAVWYVVPSNGAAIYTRQLGLPGDVPLAGDSDADGRSDFGIWRPSSQTNYTTQSTQPGQPAVQLPWGLTGNSQVYKAPR